ncbi:MAG: NUDIX hydrolase [Solirubrobacteraceae bacterium]
MAAKRPTVAARLRREGPPAQPRESASAIVVRDGAGGVELLLVRRSPEQRFMGGFWVFPGGAVDGDETHAAAAVRELHEEAGIGGLSPDALVLYSRWITPEAIQTRFDTRFYVARAPADARAHVDGHECVDARWTMPAAAVGAYAAGELALVFPTLKLLEGLTAFASVDDLFAYARALVVEPILPRVVFDGAAAHVLLPGEAHPDG